MQFVQGSDTRARLRYSDFIRGRLKQIKSATRSK
jgi:hypothetical protein